MASATCAECGRRFDYRARGKPQVTCGPECQAARRRRQTEEAVTRRVLRRTPVGALGYPETLSCRSVTAVAVTAATCDRPATVLYVDGQGSAYLLCIDHDTVEALQLADRMGLRLVSLPVAVPA